jgi:hypothetical protein
MDTSTGPAVAACSLLLLAAAFQVALAAGAPWGLAAYGGRATTSDGRLPARYRAASAATAVALLGIGWLLLLRSGAVGPASDSTVLTVACWCLCGLFALNTLGNLSGQHPVERWGMSAVTASLAVLCALVAVD